MFNNNNLSRRKAFNLHFRIFTRLFKKFQYQSELLKFWSCSVALMFNTEWKNFFPITRWLFREELSMFYSKKRLQVFHWKSWRKRGSLHFNVCLCWPHVSHVDIAFLCFTTSWFIKLMIWKNFHEKLWNFLDSSQFHNLNWIFFNFSFQSFFELFLFKAFSWKPFCLKEIESSKNSIISKIFIYPRHKTLEKKIKFSQVKKLFSKAFFFQKYFQRFSYFFFFSKTKHSSISHLQSQEKNEDKESLGNS